MSRSLAVAVLRTVPELPSARIRWRQLAQFLEPHGVSVALHDWPAQRPPAPERVRELAAADVVVVHRALPRLSDRAWLRSLGRPLVFDFDDAVMYRETRKWGAHFSLARRARFELALWLFDAFACGSRHLARSCRSRAKPVLLAPSPVPVDVPVRDHASSRAPLRIGWVGLSGNLHYLEALAPVLRRVAPGREVVVVVLSDRALPNGGVEVVHVPWELATQERELARFDVGLMPLDDTTWSRGKCAYKALQYMAAGVPPVASRVGANVEVIEHGVTGFLAAGDDEWTAALERLLGDASLRARVGLAARERVLADYSYEQLARLWAEFFAKLVDRAT